MSYLKNSQIRNSQISQSLATGPYVHTPGFGETVGLAYEETTATGLLSSQGRMKADYLGPQMAELAEMRRTGELSEDEWATFRKRKRRGKDKMDWEAMANYANEVKGTSFDMSPETMHAEASAASIERQEILDNAEGVTGFSAQVIGSIGAMANPTTAAIELAAMVIPGTQLRFGASSLGTMAKMAFREGALNVGIESVLQTQVYDFKNRVGQQYDLSEGAVNLLAAFVFGGGVGATRGAYNIHIGNTSVADAMTANRVVIDELTARTDLDAAERVILRDLTQAQEYFGTLERMDGSARAAYSDSLKDIAAKHIPNGAVVRAVEVELESIAGENPALRFDTPVYDATLQRAISSRVQTAVRRYGAMERVEGGTVTPRMIEGYKAQLTAEAGQKLTRGEVKSLNSELADLNYRMNRISEDMLPVVAKRNVPARKAKQQARKEGARVAMEERADLQSQIDAIDARLDADAAGLQAKGDLTRLEQGIIPDRFLGEVNESAGIRMADFGEEAALDDMALMQDYFGAKYGQDAQQVAGKVYNELSIRERADTVDNQNMTHRVPEEAVGPVTEDITDSASVTAKYEIDEEWAPEGDLTRSTYELGEGGELVERQLSDVLDDSNARLAEAKRQLDETVACIRG